MVEDHYILRGWYSRDYIPPKETLRARALENIPPHQNEVSEGVSIFIKKRRINILLPHRIKDSWIALKLLFVREGPLVTPGP